MEGLEPHLQSGLLLPLDAGDFTAVTSQISLVETIVGPRKRLDFVLEREFRTFLTPSKSFTVEPITLAILEKVIDLRAQYALKIPDAIHLATGILTGCNPFLTRDHGWSKTGVTTVDPANIG